MRVRTFQFIIVCLVLFPMCGCLTSVDPNTGAKKVSLDPNSAVVTVGEAAAEGVSAFGGFFGASGALIAAVAAGALGA